MMTSAIKGTTVKNVDTTTWEDIALGIDGTEVVARKVKVTTKIDANGKPIEKTEEVLEEKVLATF